MVEPAGGLPPVDREFYVGQNDWYLAGSDLDEEKALAEHPDYFTFNGHTQGLLNKKMFTNQGDKVRIFFVD